jgi:hypothetical protein
MNIKEKLEKAFASYIANALTESDTPCYEGTRADDLVYPCVIATVESIALMIPETDIANSYAANMSFSIIGNARDTLVSEHYARVETVKSALDDLETIQATMNATAPDRVVEDLHIYNARMDNSQTSGRDERNFGDVLGYVIHCQDVDGESE